MKELLLKKLTLIIIALSLPSILKATSTEEEREKLLAFSSSGKIKLAQLAIRYNCSIDELLNKFENIDPNGGNNGGLQQDVNGLLAVMGNIPGQHLTEKGTSIRNTIDPTSLTIAVALNVVAGDLGGNGTLHTRARALQQNLQALQTIINQSKIAVYGNNPPDLIPAIQAVQAIIPGTDLRNGAQLMVAARDQAQTTINNTRAAIDIGAATLPAAMTNLTNVLNPAIGQDLLQASQQIVDDKNQAQANLLGATRTINDTRAAIDIGAATLPAAMTNLTNVLNPAIGQDLLQASQQIVDDKNQAQADFLTAQTTISNAWNITDGRSSADLITGLNAISTLVGNTDILTGVNDLNTQIHDAKTAIGTTQAAPANPSLEDRITELGGLVPASATLIAGVQALNTNLQDAKNTINDAWQIADGQTSTDLVTGLNDISGLVRDTNILTGVQTLNTNLNVAQTSINNAIQAIDPDSSTLEIAIGKLTTALNPAHGVSLLQTVNELIAAQGIRSVINSVTGADGSSQWLPNRKRPDGSFPTLPPSGLNNYRDLINYLAYDNLTS